KGSVMEKGTPLRSMNRAKTAATATAWRWQASDVGRKSRRGGSLGWPDPSQGRHIARRWAGRFTARRGAELLVRTLEKPLFQCLELWVVGPAGRVQHPQVAVPGVVQRQAGDDRKRRVVPALAASQQVVPEQLIQIADDHRACLRDLEIDK